MLTMEPFWLGSQTKIQEIKVFRNRLDLNSLWIGKYEIGSLRLENWTFHYGPVIKLPLQILQSMHDQSDNFDTAFSQVFIIGSYWNVYPMT